MVRSQLVQDAKLERQLRHIYGATKKDLKQTKNATKAATLVTLTNRKIDQTQNIKDRKQAKLPTIGKIQDRKDIRVGRGQGMQVGAVIAGSYNHTADITGQTLVNPNLAGNIRAVRGTPDFSALPSFGTSRT
jgi:hypothetical protein